MYEYEIRDAIKDINSKLAYLKNYSDEDRNPFGAGPVWDARANLRGRKKELQKRLKEKLAENA